MQNLSDKIYVRPCPVGVPAHYVVWPHMRRPKGKRPVDNGFRGRRA